MDKLYQAINNQRKTGVDTLILDKILKNRQANKSRTLYNTHFHYVMKKGSIILRQ